MALKNWLLCYIFLHLISCNYSKTFNSTLSFKEIVNSSYIGQAHDTEYKKSKRAWDVGLTIGFTISAVLSFIGNSLVIHVVRTTPSMHTSVNLYIANMALSDIMSTVFCVPISIQSLYDFDTWLQGTTGLILCKLVYILFYTSFACSTFNLVAVAFDRYLAVIKPFYRYSSTIVKVTIPVIWILSIILSLPIASSYTNKFQPLRYEEYTICLDLERDHIYVAGVTIMALLCYVLPLVVASTFYTMTGCNLRMRSKVSIASRNYRAKEQAQKIAIKATRLMVTVIVMFGICWAPFFIYHMAKGWYKGNLNEELQWFYRPLCFLFASINGAINPCLYASFSGNFRSGMKSILFCNKNRVIKISQPRRPQRDMPIGHISTHI